MVEERSFQFKDRSVYDMSIEEQPAMRNGGNDRSNDSLQPLLSVHDPEPPLEVLGEYEAFRSRTGSVDFQVTIADAQVRDTGQRLALHMASVNGAIPGVVCVAVLNDSKESDRPQLTTESPSAPRPANRGKYGAPIDREPRYLIARHWRATTQAWGWEFPRGMGNPEESPVQTALRELQEETGITADTENVNILQTIHADTGILRDSIAVAVIELTPDGLPETDTTNASRTDWELDNLRWVPRRRMRELIAAGGISDGITLAAFIIATSFGV